MFGKLVKEGNRMTTFNNRKKSKKLEEADQ